MATNSGPHHFHPHKRTPKQVVSAGWTWRDTGFLLLIVGLFLLIGWLEFFGPGFRGGEGTVPPPPSARPTRTGPPR